jgi:fatty-acyl-CoA synthase
MTQSTEQLAVLDRAEQAALVPTPNQCDLPRRLADFPTFVDALDYAARGRRGLNFHDPRGKLTRPYPFSELRADAVEVAYRLIARGIVKGDRIAMVAETGADFAALFCGAIYAGAWPVPLPLPTSFGGKDNYIDQLAVQLRSSDPTLFFYPPEIAAMGDAATAAHNNANGTTCTGLSWDVLQAEPAVAVTLPEARGEDICYLQYSSGSTRFPTALPSPMPRCSTIWRAMARPWTWTSSPTTAS